MPRRHQAVRRRAQRPASLSLRCRHGRAQLKGSFSATIPAKGAPASLCPPPNSDVLLPKSSIPDHLLPFSVSLTLLDHLLHLSSPSCLTAINHPISESFFPNPAVGHLLSSPVSLSPRPSSSYVAGNFNCPNGWAVILTRKRGQQLVFKIFH